MGKWGQKYGKRWKLDFRQRAPIDFTDIEL